MHNTTAEFPRSSITFSKGTELSILLENSDFAHAELIYYSYAEQAIYAVKGEDVFCLGHLPEDIAGDIISNMRLSLSAFNDEGNMVVLDTRIQCIH
jgi:hypothetical protein